MGLINFSDLPVNTLVGADWKTFRAVTKGRAVAPGKRGKYILTKCLCRLLSLFVPLQERKYKKHLADKPLQHDPVFILGHWRSGTTFVHNIFAQDERFGYTTTYQTVFKEYCDRFLTMKQATDEEIADFKDKFMKIVKVSMWNSRRGVKDAQYLSKNPPHTGKVKTLVEMFPNAKFIYLVRNPYTVFESTRSFFTQTIAPLQLNTISQEEMEQNILYGYRELYDAYQEQKKYIPEGNLFEVKFEEFEKNALEITEQIYRELNIPNWDEARPAIEAYISKKKGHKKNSYQYDLRTIRMVNEAWGDILDAWGYERL